MSIGTGGERERARESWAVQQCPKRKWDCFLADFVYHYIVQEPMFISHQWHTDVLTHFALKLWLQLLTFILNCWT